MGNLDKCSIAKWLCSSAFALVRSTAVVRAIISKACNTPKLFKAETKSNLQAFKYMTGHDYDTLFSLVATAAIPSSMNENCTGGTDRFVELKIKLQKHRQTTRQTNKSNIDKFRESQLVSHSPTQCRLRGSTAFV